MRIASIVALLVVALLARRPSVASASASDAGVLSEDEEVMRNLDLLENLDVLEHLDQLDIQD